MFFEFMEKREIEQKKMREAAERRRMMLTGPAPSALQLASGNDPLRRDFKLGRLFEQKKNNNVAPKPSASGSFIKYTTLKNNYEFACRNPLFTNAFKGGQQQEIVCPNPHSSSVFMPPARGFPQSKALR